MQTNANKTEDVQKATENRNDYSASGWENGRNKEWLERSGKKIKFILDAIDVSDARASPPLHKAKPTSHCVCAFVCEFCSVDCVSVFYFDSKRAEGKKKLTVHECERARARPPIMLHVIFCDMLYFVIENILFLFFFLLFFFRISVHRNVPYTIDVVFHNENTEPESQFKLVKCLNNEQIPSGRIVGESNPNYYVYSSMVFSIFLPDQKYVLFYFSVLRHEFRYEMPAFSSGLECCIPSDFRVRSVFCFDSPFTFGQHQHTPANIFSQAIRVDRERIVLLNAEPQSVSHMRSNAYLSARSISWFASANGDRMWIYECAL